MTNEELEEAMHGAEVLAKAAYRATPAETYAEMTAGAVRELAKVVAELVRREGARASVAALNRTGKPGE